jgi:hypothetical protein
MEESLPWVLYFFFYCLAAYRPLTEIELDQLLCAWTGAEVRSTKEAAASRLLALLVSGVE